MKDDSQTRDRQPGLGAEADGDSSENQPGLGAEAMGMPLDQIANRPEPPASDVPPEPWTPPRTDPQSRSFTAGDGCRLHYLDWGGDPGAPLVVMIHGRRAHAHWFDPCINALHPRYRVVCPDLRGHGGSAALGPTPMQRYGEDIAELLKFFRGQAGPKERIAVVAHSFAGRPTLLAGELFGQRPDLLVMADTPLYIKPGENHPENRMTARQYPTREDAVRRFRLLPPHHSVHPDLMRYLAEKSVGQNEDGTWGWRYDDRATWRPFGSDFPLADELDLESFAMRVLLMRGEHSFLVPEAAAKRAAGRFPDCELLSLPHTYHHLMLDRPSVFNNALLEFFGRQGF